MIKKTYKNSLFLFHRDLRLNDNTALIASLQQSVTVIPCFIFDHEQVGDSNRYKSSNALQFMIESLQDLDNQLQQKGANLFLFYGSTKDIINKLISEKKIDAFFSNNDYTPFSKNRDSELKKLCAKHKIDCIMHDDALINDPTIVMKKNNTPYTVFTPYMRAARTHKVLRPQKNSFSNYYHGVIMGISHDISSKIPLVLNNNIYVHGGRKNALNILNHLDTFKLYKKERDIPALHATTGLSAHLKFGTCSVREVYEKICEQLGTHHELINQLYWRDFFTQIAYHFPHVFGDSFNKKYSGFPWKYHKKLFNAWCSGKTGFPIVDAGMRELNATGYMHNRVRMIVASFLTKNLLIDWQWGEWYFATKLVDYDPAVNNGNWQWAASTGCDAQPYFRIFNSWLQQKKFDPECLYIKKWVPELKYLTSKHIHTWYNQTSPGTNTSYPAPIVDHKLSSAYTKKLFKQYAMRGNKSP